MLPTGARFRRFRFRPIWGLRPRCWRCMVRLIDTSVATAAEMAVPLPSCTVCSAFPSHPSPGGRARVISYQCEAHVQSVPAWVSTAGFNRIGLSHRITASPYTVSTVCLAEETFIILDSRATMARTPAPPTSESECLWTVSVNSPGRCPDQMRPYRVDPQRALEVQPQSRVR